jgi:hypothetical protein
MDMDTARLFACPYSHKALSVDTLQLIGNYSSFLPAAGGSSVGILSDVWPKFDATEMTTSA